jgi:HSP20 family molecular chaperone IbpA
MSIGLFLIVTSRESGHLSDDVRVNSVDFNDGLMTVFLERVVPEHQKKKVYFG